MEKINVRHDQENSQFVIEKGNKQAKLEYSKEKNCMNFYEVFVPRSLRGKGYASVLTEEALEYAREKGIKVKPTCPFVCNFIRKNSKYNDLR